jgi:hypothetical protein
VQFGLKMAGRQRRGLAQRDNIHMSRGDNVTDCTANADVRESHNSSSEDGCIMKKLLTQIIKCNNGFYLKAYKFIGLRNQENGIDRET